MTTATLSAIEAPARASSTARIPPGRLALILQEAVTATVRLRAGRQVAPDAAAFRSHMKHLIGLAHEEALAVGYPRHYVKRAVHGFVAFVDESVLNSTQPMFAEWARKPLQEEIFGEHRAGETFFENLQELLAEQDAQEVADVLEVYLLCLELGFRGRYGSGEGDLHHLKESARRKIERVRGRAGWLSPSWAPPADETAPVARDPWLHRLVVVAGVCVALAVLLFVVYVLVLRGDAAEVQALAGQVLR